MNTSAGPSEATFPSTVTGLGTSLRLVSRTNPGQPEEPPVSSADSRLLRLATHLPENEHAWRTRQLRDLGLNADAISILVHQRILIRARTGCYVRAAYWDRFDGTGQDRLRILLHAHAAVTS
ncbi:type IV toxin-antitoxin system AbiEi family antitoxin domain-containing protein [Arthrobacter alpinus]|uniref:type IV toxin-antitoxin system AbiEi family antitoxin domain-containing protein n=1 Tax=Arthrobacter alpinus TaxID=656366 RepID=UPI0016458E8B|nr:type IV toxin-antitoxin system AbiEi family antitoxin domain-containing protein [Arthrobacter alpinus]